MSEEEQEMQLKNSSPRPSSPTSAMIVEVKFTLQLNYTLCVDEKNCRCGWKWTQTRTTITTT